MSILYYYQFKEHSNIHCKIHAKQEIGKHNINTNGGIKKGSKKQSGQTFQRAQCLLWVPERGSDVVEFGEKS